ncbi:MAG: histidine kinase [Candidatus Dormibacteria bacterium]|jgi:two-component system NarL family sensor kinase
MKRPRLALPLFNPRRRLRDRLLAAMLVVALLPLGVFTLLTVTELTNITRTTVDETHQAYLDEQENRVQQEIRQAAGQVDKAMTGIQNDLAQLVPGLAAGSQVPASATAPQGEEIGNVWAVTASGTTADTFDLVVGAAPAANTQPAAVRAERLNQLTQLQAALDKIVNTQGIVVPDGVWVLDEDANAAMISPPANTAAVGTLQGGSPMGVEEDLLLQPGESHSPLAPSPAAVVGSPFWTAPYYNLLHGDTEVTVWEDAGSNLLVGADIPLQQFSGVITSALSPAEVNSYPVLLSSASQSAAVIGFGDPGQDFSPGQLAVGARLPSLHGGHDLLNQVTAQVNGSGPSQPIKFSVGSVDKLGFATTVGPMDPPWVLLDVVPTKNLEPDVAGLTQGIQSALGSLFRSAIPIACVLVAACFLLATLFARRIVAPVKALTGAAEKLAEGGTDEAVPTQGHDEVGDLADSLERMRREINVSREAILAASRELEQQVAIRTSELRARNEELLALNELAGSLTRSLDPTAIMAGALDAVRAVLPITAGRGFVLNREGRLVAGTPEGDGRATGLEELATAAVDDNHLVTRADGGDVLIGLPIATGGGPLGALGLRSTAAPGVEMAALLMAIGNQVALALSTARLSEEGRDMAVLEERARLAREIHDTLAQQLTGIVIQLETAQALVGRDPERTVPALTSAQELARSALAEARRSVWDLRPAPLTATGVVAALEMEVDRFRKRTGLAARLRAERMAPPPALAPTGEVALLRITQQALANIAAHSGATRVTLRLRHLESDVELTIRDNGHGFDPHGVRPGAFGIVGMTERVRLAGGSFTVESAPEQGTTITVRLPVTVVTPEPAGAPA